jgi:hypothetical protein
MTRKSRRELERALEDLSTPADVRAERCSECGGLPTGSDAALGVTAPFVTYECTCDRTLPDGAEHLAGAGDV